MRDRAHDLSSAKTLRIDAPLDGQFCIQQLDNSSSGWTEVIEQATLTGQRRPSMPDGATLSKK